MKLEQLQLDIAARLASLPGFKYIPVTSIRPRSEGEALQIQTDLDQSLAGLQEKNGKSGACAIVQMPTLTVDEPNIPGPEMRAITIIRILENPLINMGDSGTQLSAEEIATNALGGLHHWDPGMGNPLVASNPAMEPNLDFPGLIGYDVFVSTRYGVPIQAYAPAPRAEAYNGTAVLTCQLADVEIRYTLDGSFPSPDAMLYQTPIDVSGVTTLRAVAYKDDLLPSSVTELTL